MVEMPFKENDRIVKFRNHHNKLKCPFVVYADTEALNIKKSMKIKKPDIDYEEQYMCSYGMLIYHNISI